MGASLGLLCGLPFGGTGALFGPAMGGLLGHRENPDHPGSHYLHVTRKIEATLEDLTLSRCRMVFMPGVAKRCTLPLLASLSLPNFRHEAQPNRGLWS